MRLIPVSLAVAAASLLAASAAPAGIPEDIAAHQTSEVHRQLGLQYELGSDVGIQNLPWIGTHNSFNSTAEMGRTLSASDANQQLKITQLLDIDVRTIELDTHLIFNPAQPGAPVPSVCHAQDTAHAGCTTEKTLDAVVSEISEWLRRPANRSVLIRLRIEDHLDGPSGQGQAAQVIDKRLGDLIHKPPASPTCVAPPPTLTRAQMRAAGKQVFLQGDCDKGAASNLRALAWANGDYEEERPKKYTDFPRCGPDFTRAEYTQKIVRYYEDSTQLTRGGSTVGATTRDDGMKPQTAAQMARCGVDIIEMDQLLPKDGRLASLVWSWAPGQPAAVGGCAVQVVNATYPFGRFEARPCTQRHRVACRNKAGNWHVALGKALPASGAPKRCKRPRTDAAHSVPRTGYEAQRLRLAMSAAKVSTVWLGYRRSGAAWRALDTRG